MASIVSFAAERYNNKAIGGLRRNSGDRSERRTGLVRAVNSQNSFTSVQLQQALTQHSSVKSNPSEPGSAVGLLFAAAVLSVHKVTGATVAYSLKPLKTARPTRQFNAEKAQIKHCCFSTSNNSDLI
jgi:hypothetical protein